jgi:pheromone shutdown-related protein TraB
MNDMQTSLPSSVRHIQIEDKNYYLLGTAHVSKESVQDVQNVIETLNPDSVCVELCPARHQAMTQQEAWKKMDIIRVIKQKKSLFLLAQLIMTAFYRKIGEKLGVQPGAEMLEAIHMAEKHNAQLVLADRDVEITLKRVWGYLNLWNKLKMIFQLMLSLFVQEKVDEEMIEDLKNKDQLESLLESFASSFPEVKKRLIDERDMFLAHKIQNAPGQNIVAVVGAGHISGIKKHLREEIDVQPILEVPPKSVVPGILKWLIPLVIVFLLIYGFFQSGTEHSLQSIYIWILVNGILSSLGAALAFAHPLTIAATFVGAPLTSLNPMVAAGWVAGLVQAWVKKPTVADLEDLPRAIATVRGFWLNPLSRILLVVVLANIGSSLGTFISGSWIAVRIF